MEKIDNADTSPSIIYIQHHHYCYPSSTTTKLLVASDGSSRIDKEHSFNNALYTGQNNNVKWCIFLIVSIFISVF